MKMYTELIEKYKPSVENQAVWDNFVTCIKDMTSIEEIYDLKKIVEENLSINVEEDFISSKGHAEYKEGKVSIILDITNPSKINRFTMAHELAHILFDWSDLKKEERIESNYINDELLHEDREIRANQFAAELLMPSKEVIDKIRLLIKSSVNSVDDVANELSDFFAVSYSAAINRMRNLGVIKS